MSAKRILFVSFAAALAAAGAASAAGSPGSVGTLFENQGGNVYRLLPGAVKTAVVADFDLAVDTGKYTVQGDVHAPASGIAACQGAGARWALDVTEKYNDSVTPDANAVSQVAQCLAAGGSAERYVRVRTLAGGWDPWAKFLNSSSVNGALNYVAKFTPDGNSLGNSLLRDNGAGVGVGTAPTTYALTAGGDVYANGGWLRTSGNAGWQSDTWGGGWYMKDANWVRAYNGKGVWADSVLGADAGLSVGYGGAAPAASGAIVAGAVGVGTPNPAGPLHVRKNLAGGLGGQIFIDNATDGTGTTRGLEFYRGGYAQPYMSSIRSVDNGSWGADLTFSTKVSGVDGTTGMLERLRLKSNGFVLASGWVGLGTSNPAGPLEVKVGDSGDGDRLAVYQDAANTVSLQTLLDGVARGSYGTYGTGQNVLALQPMVGRVGIGTKTPAATLDVYASGAGIGASNNDGIAIRGGTYAGLGMATSGAKSFVMQYANNGVLYFQRESANFGGYEANPVSFDLGAPGWSLNLSPVGNVGIGTLNPSARLHVIEPDSGSSAGIILDGSRTDNKNTILFKNSYWAINDIAGMASIRALDSGTQGGHLVFATTTENSGVNGVPTERMRIDQYGNVGIGNISKDRLTVNQNWRDNSPTDWGGGITLQGNAPSIQFQDVDNAGYRWMWHVNSDTMNLYVRDTWGGAGWNRLAYFDTTGLMALRAVCLSGDCRAAWPGSGGPNAYRRDGACYANSCDNCGCTGGWVGFNDGATTHRDHDTHGVYNGQRAVWCSASWGYCDVWYPYLGKFNP